MIIYYIVAFIVVGIDQFVKYITVRNIPLHEVREFIPGFLSWTYIRNTGAAWSILEGQMWFFYLVTVVVVLVIFFYMQKYGRDSHLLASALALMLAGSIGNFIDRLRLQYVVDMIRLEFIDFPIFNVADMSLVIGVGLMMLYVFLDEKKQA